MKKTISIIIPLYNKEDFIIETLDSVINQTTNVSEVIIIDDNSTDNSLALVKKYQQNHPKIVSVYSNTSGISGGSSCRNIGISKSRSSYLTFLDADDLISLSFCEGRLKKNIEDFDFCVFPMGTFYEKIGDSKFVWNNFKGNHLDRFLKHDLPWAICSILWKKEFLIKLKGFNTDFDRLQDVELHTRALLTQNVKYEIFSNGEPDCFYRISETRISFNYEDFMQKRVSGNLKYISFFHNELSHVAPSKVVHLKSTLFNAKSRISQAYLKGHIDQTLLVSLYNKLNHNLPPQFLNLKDRFLLKIYESLIKRRLYFRGLDRITNTLMILW